MPVAAALMDSLVERYGKDKAERIYYAMEGSARGPFAEGNKHHADHVAFAERNGVPPVGKRKARPRKGRAVKPKVKRPKGPVRSRATRK